MTGPEAIGNSSPEGFKYIRLVGALYTAIGYPKKLGRMVKNVKQARHYERLADKYMGTEIGEMAKRGKSLYNAGRYYLEAGLMNHAERNLESAQHYLEAYGMTGAYDAYNSLLSLYPTMASLYDRTGQTDKLEDVMVRDIDLHADMAEHFGLEVTIGHNHARVIRHLPTDFLEA